MSGLKELQDLEPLFRWIMNLENTLRLRWAFMLQWGTIFWNGNFWITRLRESTKHFGCFWVLTQRKLLAQYFAPMIFAKTWLFSVRLLSLLAGCLIKLWRFSGLKSNH